MSNKDGLQKTIIAVLVVLLVGALGAPLSIVLQSAQILSVGLDNDPGGVEGFNRTGAYNIDTDSILKAIQENSPVIFLPESTALPPVNPLRNTSWTEAEYLRVTREFFSFAWKETLDNDWSIHKMSFFTNCQENPAGFYEGTFVFFQLIFQQGKLEYKARAVNISPTEGKVRWGGDNVFPRPIFGANVDTLDDLSITADEALKIAEEHGGKTIRQSVQNHCTLHLYFNRNWRVVYANQSNGLSILEIDVDPHTGNVLSSR